MNAGNYFQLHSTHTLVVKIYTYGRCFEQLSVCVKYNRKDYFSVKAHSLIPLVTLNRALQCD